MAGRDCDDALHELYGYLDGELTVERREIIKQHLDDCPPCGDSFEFEAELRSLIARKCTESVPDSLKQRIADALDKESRKA